MSSIEHAAARQLSGRTSITHTDVVLIGAGIMSAHLATLIHLLEPQWSIQVFERADSPATESSDSWNNAGTGHAALCELNYTPANSHGEVDITKAVAVNEKFQISQQWWAYAVRNGILGNPKDFINSTSHVSFVHGADNVYYLKKRYEALRKNTLFDAISYSQDRDVFAKKLPLMAKGRDYSTPFAISWFDDGTDISYGALTRQLFGYLSPHIDTFYGYEVTNVQKDHKNNKWKISVINTRTREKRQVNAKFAFIGAGGYSLLLLQKSGIAQRKDFAGFPVSGVFARCTNPDVIAEHSAKVYGKAAVGAPPMSAPHLDTRIIDGKKGLLFGPYGAWSPKFLKQGSYRDLLASVKLYNVLPMTSVAFTEFPLLKFLISELTKTQDGRLHDLQVFYPKAKAEDWEIIIAGQRVQIIRKSGKKGILEFGTAVVTSEDGTLATLLGASPGASIVVSAMIEVLQKCFPAHYDKWRPQLEEMIPALGTKLSGNPKLFHKIAAKSKDVLQLSTSFSVRSP